MFVEASDNGKMKEARDFLKTYHFDVLGQHTVNGLEGCCKKWQKDTIDLPVETEKLGV